MPAIVQEAPEQRLAAPSAAGSESIAWFEGSFVPLSEARVSVATHALHYGTACFEGIRGYWSEAEEQLYLFRLREHYERFHDSMKLLMMRPKLSVDDLCALTVELVARHAYRQDVYVRPLAYKSTPTIKLALSRLDDEIAIFTFPMGDYVDIHRGLSVCTSSWRRANSNAMPVRAKVSGAYVNCCLAVDDAEAAGFDEAILLTHDGCVSEGSSANLFLLRNGRLITPAVSEDILEGITRDSLIALAREELGLEVEERRVDRTELYAAEEIFFCGTGVQLSPVTSVDRRAVGDGRPGRYSLRLQEAYLRAARGQDPDRRSWLTAVDPARRPHG